jgi:hypothetical protein
MTLSLTELPIGLQSVKTKSIFVLRLDVRPLQLVGDTPGSYRRVGVIPGGVFEGDRLSGTVLDGGNDWQSVRSDSTTVLNVRLVLKATGGDLIGMTYGGLRHGPPDIIKRIEAGEVLDPSTHYFRINPVFETSSQQYGWLNRILAIGIGQRRSDGVTYSVFEVL